MEVVCERENLKEAVRRVKANKGSAGVDGMTVDQLTDYLKQHWPAIGAQLLEGTYQPRPVRRVEIPKPDGGVRKLGIPTVLDRFVQQAVMQVLQRQWDPTFSNHSYGFRPQRSAQQAVARAQQNISEGFRWVVDLDLEKFFDRVNHDKLMGPTSFMQRQTELGKRGFQPSKASNFGQEFSPITACAEGPVPEKSHRPTRAVSPETLPIADAVRGLAIDLIVPQNLFVPLSSWEGAPILYATAQSEYQ